MQANCIFYLSTPHTQCFVDFSKARNLPPSHGGCTNLLLLGLHFIEYKTMKKSIGIEDMAKPFVNTKVQICWWCNPKCYSDPHEWSHDAFMMACMYCNAMEWCLVVGDIYGCNTDMTTSACNILFVLPPSQLLQQMHRQYLEKQPT